MRHRIVFLYIAAVGIGISTQAMVTNYAMPITPIRSSGSVLPVEAWAPTPEQLELIQGVVEFDQELYDTMPKEGRALLPIAVLPISMVERDRPWTLPATHWQTRGPGFHQNKAPVPEAVKALPGYVPGAPYVTHSLGTNVTYSLLKTYAAPVVRGNKTRVEFEIQFYDDLGSNPVARVTRTGEGKTGFVETKVIVK